MNIGTKRAGYLPKEEILINIKKRSNEQSLLINTTRDFFLVAQNYYTGQCILSIKRLNYIRAWKRIKQFYIEEIVFNLKIEYVNKGGIITQLEGIQGFIPKSHISQKYIIKQNFSSKLLKDTEIQCKILTINENKNQLILSNKSANLTLSKHRFKLGELIYGRITSIRPYGLFISINNVKALLHVSEIGYVNSKEQENVLAIGKLIKVKIIHLNVKQGLLSTSIRNVNENY